MFDYGSEMNLIKYGQKTPPKYNIRSINSTKIALIYGPKDVLNDLEDIKILKQQLTGNILLS